MKKLTIKVFICLFFPFSLFSQNNWKTTGNSGALPNPITATSFLGTTNNFPLSLKTTLAQPINFFTTNTQRMRITPTGLVGIGNAFNTPANRLHLFQPSGTFGLQITNTTTGNSAANGFSMNLIGAGPDNDLINLFIS